jgi:transcriptional regulator with XRE-family HTH domain
MPRARVYPDGERVVELRGRNGLSQLRLARKAGYSKKTIERVEKSLPTSISTMDAIAGVFKVEVTLLLKVTTWGNPGHARVQLVVDEKLFSSPEEAKRELGEKLYHMLLVANCVEVHLHSIELIYELTLEDALRLLRAVERGELNDFGVLSTRLLGPRPETPPATIPFPRYPRSWSELARMDQRPAWLAGLRENDRDSWFELDRVFQRLVVRDLERMGLQYHDALDAYQSALGEMDRLLRGAVEQLTLDHLARLIRVIAQRRRIDSVRYRAAWGGAGGRISGGEETEPALEDIPAKEERFPWWERESAMQLIAAAFERIRPPFRDIAWRAIEMRYLEERPYADIAVALSRTEQSVRSLVWRALHAIRVEIERMGEDEP